MRDACGGLRLRGAFLGALLLLVGHWLLFFESKRSFVWDSFIYWSMSDSLLKTGSWDEVTGICSALYTPGYPLFISGLRLTSDNVSFILWAQIVVSLIIPLMVALLAHQFFGPLVAVLTYCFTALNVGFFVLPHFLLSETLFIFLMVAALYFFVRGFKAPGFYDVVLSGFLWGLAIVIKPAPFLLMPFLAFFLGISRKSVISALFFLCVVSILPGLLLARNYYAYGAAHVKSVDKYNIYMLFLPKLLAVVENTSREEEEKKIEALLPPLKNYADPLYWQHVEPLLIKAVWARPDQALFIWIYNSFRTLFAPYTTHIKMALNVDLNGEAQTLSSFEGNFVSRMSQYLSSGTTYLWVVVIGWFEVFYTGSEIVLMILGFLALLLRKKWFEFFLFGSFIGYFLIITGADGCGRLRMAPDIGMMIVAAYGLSVLLEQKWHAKALRK